MALRSTFTVVEPDAALTSDFYGSTSNDNFSHADVNLRSSKKYCCTLSAKKIRVFAITTGLIVAILLSMFILLVEHHPSLAFWNRSENEDSRPVDTNATRVKPYESLMSDYSYHGENSSKHDFEPIHPNGISHHHQHANFTAPSSAETMPETHRRHHPAKAHSISRNRHANANADADRMSDNIKNLVQPRHYDIYIRLASSPYDEPSFRGNVSITLMVREQISNIVLGARDLRILSAAVNPVDMTHEHESYDIAIDSYEKNDGLLVLRTRKPLKPNCEYILNIEYLGDLNPLSYGLFKITSDLGTGTRETRTLIAANTDVPFARTIFPCFDLQTQTATYQLHLCRHSSMQAVSSGNSVLQSFQSISESCVWDYFEKTTTLPVRSFSFALSDYNPQRIMMKRRSMITVWTPIKRADATAYLLGIIPKLVEIYENYFGFEYPCHHLEYYSVPTVVPYMPAKYGIVITSESNVLIDRNKASSKQIEQVAKTAALHVAEQWIQNITFGEYQDEWIINSLLQYLQYRAINTIESSWKIFDKFYTNVLQTEMDVELFNPSEKHLKVVWVPYMKRLNARLALYPVNETSVFQDAHYRDKILHSVRQDDRINPAIYSQLFIQRDINKGVCLFRMLEHILTESVFRNCIKKFLEHGRRRAVDAQDLWDIMTVEAANFTVPGYQLLPTSLLLEDVVNEWLFTSDFPILTVERNYQSGEILFMQFIDTTEKRETYVNRVTTYRHLPVSYTTQREKLFSATAPKMWLKNAQKTVIKYPTTLANNTWILVNPQQTGLFRVNYDAENWRMLKKSLVDGELPSNVRAQLMDDALFLARSNYLNYEVALDLVRTLPVYGEKEFIVWNTVLRHLTYVENIINSIEDQNFEKQRILFKTCIRELITPLYNQLVLPQSDLRKVSLASHEIDHTELQLKALILDWACKVQIEDCRKKVKKEFDEWKRSLRPDDENPIDPDFQYPILCNSMRYGDKDDFEFLYFRYLNCSMTDENQSVYLRGLYCYKNIGATLPSIISDTIRHDYSLSHLHDVNDIWQALIETPVTTTVPLDYLLAYWTSILAKFSNFVPILKNVVEGATANVNKEEQLNSLYRLQADVQNTPYLSDIFRDVVGRIKRRIKWKYHELHIFLAKLDKFMSVKQN